MAVYSLNINKENPLFKEASSAVKITRENAKGDKKTEPFRGKLIPGVFKQKRIKWDSKKRRYPVTLKQKDLDVLVERMNLVDDEGNRIKTADRYNKFDPFFKHDDLYYHVSSDVHRMDDEDPKDKLFLNYFQNTKGEIHLYGDDQVDSRKSDSQVHADFVLIESKTLDEALDDKKYTKVQRATELINGSELKKSQRVKILKAMGIVNADKMEQDLVNRELFNRVVYERDRKVNNEKYIDLFLRLADSSEADLDIESMISDARSLYIIKKSGSNYKFGSYNLGSTLKEVKEFLSEKRNSDILERLKEDVDNKNNK